MWLRSLKKLIISGGAILFLCLISFLLLQWIPGDPVLARLQESGVTQDRSASVYQSPQYRQLQEKLGRHLPVFYFSIRSAAIPDAISSIRHPSHRKLLADWCIRYGNAEAILKWYDLHQQILAQLLKNRQPEAFRALQSLLDYDDAAQQQNTYRWVINELALSPIHPKLIKTATQHEIITSGSGDFRAYLPLLQWNHTQNQFHLWIWGNEHKKGILQGNLGVSQRDGQRVTQKILPAFKTTLSLAAVAIFLMYMTAVPLGLRLSGMKNPLRVDAIIRVVLGLYAMPGYWLGVLMLIFLCSPDFLNWFPVAYSLMNLSEHMSLIERTLIILHHLILPVTCWSIGGAAFLTIQTFRRSNDIQRELYITTARAKGLPESAIIRKHVFKNAIIPAISMLGSLVPAALSGAIAIELIFSIPGMGKLIFTAFHTRDYPVVMGILLLVGTIAILATSAADVILHKLDPRSKNVNHT